MPPHAAGGPRSAPRRPVPSPPGGTYLHQVKLRATKSMRARKGWPETRRGALVVRGPMKLMAMHEYTTTGPLVGSPGRPRGLHDVRRTGPRNWPRRARARASSVIAVSAAAAIAARPAAAVAEWCARRSAGSGGAGAVVVRSGAFAPPQPATALLASSGVRTRLTQQRTRRLLEDLAPGADLLLLRREVPDDLANARGGDLDAVALADLAEAVVVLRQLERDRLEAMLGDAHARAEVQDRRLEHQLVVGLGLDEHDVDARIALLPLARHLVQALVREELEGLVADLREAHVADALRAREDAPDPLGEVVDIGHQRVDDHDELRARLDGQVEVRRRHDPAVDELAVADLDRLVDHRQRGRGAHGLRDRGVGPARPARDSALGR